MANLYCEDVHAEFPDAPGCCSSCHEDEASEELPGDYPLSDITLDGKVYYICCPLVQFLRDMGGDAA